MAASDLMLLGGTSELQEYNITFGDGISLSSYYLNPYQKRDYEANHAGANSVYKELWINLFRKIEQR